MYEFLTGPMLWAAFLIFVIGLARRVVLYIRGLDWRLERVAYGPGRKIGMKGAISSVFQWLVPFGTHSWRKQPYFTIAFFLFHIGVVIVPLFLAGHMVIMQERFGFSLPSLPMWFSDAFTVLAIVGAFMMILRRVALPEVRFLTNWGDWGILLLVWSALLAVQLLSYYGVLPLGKVHVGFILVSCVGMGVSIGHFWKRKPKS